MGLLAAGAVFTGLVGIVGALIGARFTEEREHAKWLREKRLEAYQRLMTAVHVVGQWNESEARRNEQLVSVAEALDHIYLLGPPRMADSGRMVFRSAREHISREPGRWSSEEEAEGLQRGVMPLTKARDAFEAAARNVLKSND